VRRAHRIPNGSDANADQKKGEKKDDEAFHGIGH